MDEWFRIRGPKRKVWPIFETTSRECPELLEHPDGGEMLGFCAGDQSVVVRTDNSDAEEGERATYPTRARNIIVVHELCHVALTGAPRAGWVREMMRSHPSRWHHAMEEIVVNALAPRLFPILTQLEFRLPPRR